MVPREPLKKDEHEDGAPSGSGDDESLSDSSASEPQDGVVEDLEEMEQEYHTEESDDDEANDEGVESDRDSSRPTAPLLPQELLKPLPSPAKSAPRLADIPLEQMTRQQRVAARNRSRKAKKRVWDRLRRDSQGAETLEAGKAAQVKRGVVSQREKVKSGRIEKAGAKPQTSGRQRLLDGRKKAAEQNERKLMPPSKKPRKRRVP